MSISKPALFGAQTGGFPHNHIVQFYDSDDSPLLDNLGRVIGSALGAGDSAVVIATESHRNGLIQRLVNSGLDADMCVGSGRLITLDAAEVLAKFMAGGWPDAEGFAGTVGGVIRRAIGAARGESRVVAFGEMVSILWADGKFEAAVRLEQMWNELAQVHKFVLYCAYPIAGFDHAAHGKILQQICSEHSHVIPTEGYTALTSDDERLRTVLLLQQKALALETEVSERRKIQNELELREAEQKVKVRELESLFDLTRALNTAVSLEQVYADTIRALVKAVGADRASILAFDTDSRMHFKAWHGLSTKYRTAVDGHSPWRADEPDPAIIAVNDVALDERMDAYRGIFAEEGIRALAFVPIAYETRLLGKFMIYFNEPHVFSSDELRLAQTFAAHIAVAIHRHKAEAALRQSEKLAAAGRLAATVAHEINNPLEAVVNLLYLSKEDPAVPAHVRQFLNDADSELKRISYLSKQTLGFYRESGTASRSQVGVHIRQLLDLLEPKTRNKAIAVTLEINEDPAIHAVPGELKQLFANLLNNSIDAIEDRGKIVIRVSGHKQNGRSGAQITIYDSGPGIPRTNIARIFEPFFTTKKDVGTGLGLWICKGIVQKYSGKLRIRSNTTPGSSWTVVSLFLPSAAGRETNAAHPAMGLSA